MKSSYKEMMKEIRLDEQTKSRMLARLTEADEQPIKYEHEEQEGNVISIKRVSRKPVKGLVIAAVAVCLCMGTALAVYNQVFYNPVIVKSAHELRDMIVKSAGDEETTIGMSAPATGTPISQEEVIQDWSFAANDWDSETTIGGSFTSQYSDWQSVQVLKGEGSLKSRVIYNANGAEKQDYTAEDPAQLLDLLSGHISLNLAWANEHLDYVPYGNRYYHIYAGDGADVGECLYFLYACGDKAYITTTITCDLTHTSTGVTEGIKEGSYDEAYYYTTSSGMEFLITSCGDIVWAECSTANCDVDLYAGYVTAAQVEDFLDHLELSLLDVEQED